VVGSYNSAEEMFENCKDFSRIDLAIIDQNLKGISGSEAISTMRKIGIQTPVILLSVEEEESLKTKVNAISNVTVFNKSIQPENLRAAIIKHSKKLVKDKNFNTNIEYLRSILTDREIEFLRLACHEDEFTYEEISQKMDLHIGTVDGFRKSLFTKLKVKSKTGLVMKAIRNRWVP
jgi:DNA-binding NarL/FixJ family response regulator